MRNFKETNCNERKNFLQKFTIGTGGIVVASHFISAQTKRPQGEIRYLQIK